MKNQQYGILLVAAAAMALANRPALANVCDMHSPLHEHLGEQYWDVEFTSENANMPLASHGALIKADSRQAQALFDVLELFNDRHYGSGEGVRHICKGAPHERRVVVFESELRPGMYSEKDSGEQRLHFLESAESDEDKILFDDRVIVDLPTADQWQVVADNAISTSLVFRRANGLRFDDPVNANRREVDVPSSEDVEDVEDDQDPSVDDVLKDQLLSRVTNYSILQQIDTTLAKTRRGIELTQTMYINGHRETWATWLLEK